MKNKKAKSMGSYIALGLAIGLALGIAMDNVGVGLALGIAIGAAIGGGATASQKDDENSAGDTSEPENDK